MSSFLNDILLDNEEIGFHTPETQTENALSNLSSQFNVSETQWLLIKASMAALTSGLGGFPLYLFGELPKQTMGFCIIFAAGLMTGCSVVLFMEALEVTTILNAIIYSLIGVAIIHTISHYVSNDVESFEFAGLKGSSASKAFLIVLSMGLHSLGEGVKCSFLLFFCFLFFSVFLDCLRPLPFLFCFVFFAGCVCGPKKNIKKWFDGSAIGVFNFILLCFALFLFYFALFCIILYCLFDLNTKKNK